MNSLLLVSSNIRKLVALDRTAYPTEFILIEDQFNSDITGEFLLYHFIVTFLKEQSKNISIRSYQSIPNTFHTIAKKLLPSFDKQRIHCNETFNEIELETERFISNHLTDNTGLFILDGLSNLVLLVGDQNLPSIINLIGTLFRVCKERKIIFIIRNTFGYCKLLDLYLNYLLENEIGLELSVECLQSGDRNNDANGLLKINSYDKKERFELKLLFKFIDNCQVNFVPK